MRVLIVNTSEKTGGAAIAANRLKNALNHSGVKAKMLVRDKETDDITVVGLKKGLWSRWKFLWERWCIFFHLGFTRKNLFQIDTAQVGYDITQTREFREADVIHLHWINQGMLSLRGIRKILNSGKPVVWTMHDFWPATTLCHYPLQCKKYHIQCHHCRLLPGSGSEHDLSYHVWNKKKAMLRGQDIVFVACSKWLAGEARKSKLLEGQRVESIPNPIDMRLFHPDDKATARKRLRLPEDKKLILFVSQRITNHLKGIPYLIEACNALASDPDMKDAAVVVLGSHGEEIAERFEMPVYPLGYVSDPQKIAEVYHAVDLFVIPSLSDNLPNSIMEALASGVPCVGFHVGGIPEMIDHMKNGYVAKSRDAADLAKGIRWVLVEADQEQLSRAAVAKVQHNYSPQSVALRYIETYNEAIALKKYKL